MESGRPTAGLRPVCGVSASLTRCPRSFPGSVSTPLRGFPCPDSLLRLRLITPVPTPRCPSVSREPPPAPTPPRTHVTKQGGDSAAAAMLRPDLAASAGPRSPAPRRRRANPRARFLTPPRRPPRRAPLPPPAGPPVSQAGSRSEWP